MMETDGLGNIVVQLTPGEPVTGGWCDPCALPSLVRLPIYQLRPQGVSLIDVVQVCEEHGGLVHLGSKPDLLEFPQ